MVLEKELRRQSVFTDFHKSKLPNECLYSRNYIFYEDLRIILETPTNPGKVEKKTNVETTPYLLVSDVGQSLELCYKNEETPVEEYEMNWLLSGILAKKRVYVETENLILYVLIFLETKLGFLTNKIILELENPDDCSEHERSLFMKIAYKYRLLIDERKINRHFTAIENAYHTNVLVPPTETLHLKVDGERGILLFHDDYQTYSNNTIAICLNEKWHKRICFYLKYLNIIAEYVNGVLVIIDLAVSSHTALQRFDFIQKLAANVRQRQDSGMLILFQGYDREIINQKCRIDGYIMITANAGIIKLKEHATVDLECVFESNNHMMVDSDGFVYSVVANTLGLSNKQIYECILDKGLVVTDILRARNDKFCPNSRETVISNLNSQMAIKEEKPINDGQNGETRRA